MRGRSYIDNIIVKYLDWRQKEGYNYCKVCGKEIKLKIKNSNAKYCNKCAKIIQSEQVKEWKERKKS